MQRNQVDSIFSESARKRNKIIGFICVIALVLVAFLFFLIMFIDKNKNEYVKYREDSNINYKVYLKENNYFEKEYAEEKKQYIASLIDYISADFNYKINVVDKSIDFKYSYYIDATIDVKENNSDRSLYNYSEVLLEKEFKESYAKSNMEISKNIQIDYNKYNELIKNFIGEYKLNSTESTLTVNLHVQTIGSCEDFEKTHNNESVVSLVIPLTTKTVAIDISNDLVENSDNILLCTKEGNPLVYLIPVIITFVIEMALIISLARFIVKNRSPKDIYKIEFKKIVSNYHSYIQKVNSGFNLKGYQVVAVDSFNDMLEIRDTLQQPILMIESETKNGVYFIIPSNTKILYTYSLKQSDIEKKMKEEQ